MFPSTLTTQRMILNHVREILAATIVFVISCAPSALPKRPQTLAMGPVRQIGQVLDGPHAYETVKCFTQLLRVAAGPGFDSCVQFIESNLDRVGMKSEADAPLQRKEISQCHILIVDLSRKNLRTRVETMFAALVLQDCTR